MKKKKTDNQRHSHRLPSSKRGLPFSSLMTMKEIKNTVQYHNLDRHFRKSSLNKSQLISLLNNQNNLDNDVKRKLLSSLDNQRSMSVQKRNRSSKKSLKNK